jgi:hypothetical protein
MWMVHIVEEIKLLLLPGNRMVMTSRLATVGQTYPRKHVTVCRSADEWVMYRQGS